MEPTAGENLSQGFGLDKRDSTVAIPRQRLLDILTENENVTIKLRAMDNLQYLLAETSSRLNEAKTSLSHYMALHERSTQRVGRLLSLLCAEDASRKNKEFGGKARPREQSEHHELHTRTESSIDGDDLMAEWEIERTHKRYGIHDEMEFYISDIDTLRPEIVMLPDPTGCNIEGDRSRTPDDKNCDDDLVEYTVEEDGGLASLDVTKKTDIEDDEETKHGDLGLEHSHGTEVTESSEALEDHQWNCRTSLEKSGDVLESRQRQTSMQTRSILVKSSDFVDRLSDVPVRLIPPFQRNRVGMLMEDINESDIGLKHTRSDSELRRQKPSRQKDSNEEFEGKENKQSDLLIPFIVNEFAEVSVASNDPRIQITNACAYCKNAERVHWLTDQNTRLKTLVRSILDRVSLTPAAFLKLQEYEDTVVQLRQRIRDLERRLSHLQLDTPAYVKIGASLGDVGQRSKGTTIKISRLERSVYIKQILIDALYRRIQQLNQECHYHHPQQQQQQQQSEKAEYISQALSVSKSGHELQNDPSVQFLESILKGTSTIQSSYSLSEAADIPGTITVYDTSYDPRVADIPGTTIVQDTCYHPTATDIPGTMTVRDTRYDPETWSETSRSPIVSTETQQRILEDRKQPETKQSHEMVHDNFFKASSALLSPGLSDWIGSRIDAAPAVDLVGDEKDDEELISIHSLDVFVCPRCEREFDTSEERRYVDHCQKCLDFG